MSVKYGAKTNTCSEFQAEFTEEIDFYFYNGIFYCGNRDNTMQEQSTSFSNSVQEKIIKKFLEIDKRKQLMN
jgi:hypothetical protein